MLGCRTTNYHSLEERGIQPVETAEGETGVVLGGQFYNSDSIAQQTAMYAQGLPTEPWYTKVLPNLFSVDIEEVRVGLMLYGIQMEAWRETIVNIEFPTVTHPDGTTLGGGSVRFPTSQPPDPPEFMSGLQRLGITGQQILTGFLAWMTIDLAKTAVTQPNDPTIVSPEVITVPAGQ